MKRLEIEINQYDLRIHLVDILALKGWKTWIEKRKGLSYSDDFIVCCEVPDEAVKEA